MALGLPTRRERGAAAVEFAIILPLLLLLLGGIVDFGRFFYYEIALANATREGARVMAIGSPGAYNRAFDALDANMQSMVSAGDVTLAVSPCADDGTGSKITTATAEYGTFTWILLEPAMSLFGSGVDKVPTSQAEMRCNS